MASISLVGRWRFFVVLAVAVVVAWPSTGTARELGVVLGTVFNGSPGSRVPSETPVTLTRYVSGIPVETFHTNLAADGMFSFHELETDPDIIYQVHVTHHGAKFSSSAISFSDSPLAEVGLEIFELTDIDPGIEISRHITVYTPDSHKVVRAMEVLTLINPSDDAFFPQHGQRSALALPLAEGAFDFVIMFGLEPSHLQFVGDNVSIERPVLPGTSQISFAYRIPWKASGIDVQRRTVFRTRELVIMGPAEELEVVAKPIDRTDDTVIAGRRLWVWKNSEPIAPGATFSLRLRDPAPTLISRISEIEPTQWGLASISLALGSLAVYLGFRFSTSGLVRNPPVREQRARELLLAISESGNEQERIVYMDELGQILNSDEGLTKKLLGGEGFHLNSFR